MSNVQRLLKHLQDSQRGRQQPMDDVMRVFYQESGKAAAQFTKAYRESTAWQHERSRDMRNKSEGIGGA